MALPSNSYRRGGDRYYGEMTDVDEERMLYEIADEVESNVDAVLDHEVYEVTLSIRVERGTDTDDVVESIEVILSDWPATVTGYDAETVEVGPE